MKNSIKSELAQHVLDCIDNGMLNDDNVSDWHFHLFNEDYYIVYSREAEKWLEKHGVSAYEAIGYCIEYERAHFGEVYSTYASAETTVNMYVYVLGEEFLADVDGDTIEHLRGHCKSFV